MLPTKVRSIWPSCVRVEDFQKLTNRKKNFLWRSCLLTDWDKMSNIYKRTFHRCFQPSFGSVGLAVSSEKIFRNRPIRKKNRLWWPCLLMDWNIMSNIYRGPSIDASYQVSVHLAMLFQRRRFLEIDQSETRIACGGNVCQWIGTK